MKRRIYDRQFKLAAVKLAQSGDMTIFQTARELNISASTLYRWIDEWARFQDNAFPGNGSPVINAQYESKKLQKKLVYLEQENELLKKFQAFLKRNKV